MTRGLKQLDPEKIFRHADRLSAAEQHLRTGKTPNDYALYTAASVVLSAFVSELYLKCMIVLNGQTPPNKHHLLVLFNKLTLTQQMLLGQHWKTYVSRHLEPLFKITEKATSKPVPRDLQSCLKIGANTFENMRYAYEDNFQSVQFYLIDLPPVLRTCITNERPEWMAYQLPKAVPVL